MNRIINISLIIVLVFSTCKNNNGSNKNKVTKKNELTKKEFYLVKMKEKNFQLEINGPCNDALDDTIHKRSIVYFDSKVITDTNLIVEFKFINACCQEFLGDYSIVNDTLIYKFEQVNDVVCSCLCWYRYKLTINEPNRSYKEIKFEEK